MWQQTFEKYRDLGFTVVGIALDSEGIAPAKIYYDQYEVTFPALVDPNYATRLTAVPKTFFVNEHGVVQELDDWQKRLVPEGELAPVTDVDRRKWTETGARLDAQSIAALVAELENDPNDLAAAVDLASRYLDLGLKPEAARVLRSAVERFDARAVARGDDVAQKRLLAQAYFQLSRASADNREDEVRYATISFYLNPSVGYGKQIARIIAPEKFDHRPNGDFDNRFREATLRRLRAERRKWLEGE